jgi:hypothetical protein
MVRIGINRNSSLRPGVRQALIEPALRNATFETAACARAATDQDVAVPPAGVTNSGCVTRNLSGGCSQPERKRFWSKGPSSRMSEMGSGSNRAVHERSGLPRSRPDSRCPDRQPGATIGPAHCSKAALYSITSAAWARSISLCFRSRRSAAPGSDGTRIVRELQRRTDTAAAAYSEGSRRRQAVEQVATDAPGNDQDRTRTLETAV